MPLQSTWPRDLKIWVSILDILKKSTERVLHGHLFSYSSVSPDCSCSLFSSVDSANRDQNLPYSFSSSCLYIHTHVSLFFPKVLSNQGNTLIIAHPQHSKSSNFLFSLCRRPCAIKGYREVKICHVAQCWWHTHFLSCHTNLHIAS